MRVRTVSAVLVWFAAALLIANIYFSSEALLALAIALVVVAVLIFFVSRPKRGRLSNQVS